jgi:DNA-3-methyladenine glycosylase II
LCLDIYELKNYCRRGMATFIGKDVSKLKAKGGGKWKYMSEKEMLEISEKFAPYR